MRSFDPSDVSLAGEQGRSLGEVGGPLWGLSRSIA